MATQHAVNVRLATGPWSALMRWWDLRRVLVRTRWAESDLVWHQRHLERDRAQIDLLKSHLAELRVQRAQLER